MCSRNINAAFLALGFITLMIIALAGCQSVPPTTACPALIQYDQSFRDRLAGEVERLPSDSAVARAVADYAGLRAAVRACGG